MRSILQLLEKYNVTAVIIICAAVLFMPFYISAQGYDLLIQNGHVIDAKNNVDAKKDISIFHGRIAQVADHIAATGTGKVIDASGLYVVPGLIDIHTHVFVGTKPDQFADGINSVSPDDFSFRSGVTTVVDAGTSGWRNFPLFKKQVIDKSQTRVLAFLNIAGSGMSGKPSQENLDDMNADSAISLMQKYRDTIIGVKIGHYEGAEWTPFETALKVGRTTNTPLLVECHLPKFSLEEQLQHMRPGDIITHSFEKVTERMPVVDEQGKLRSFVLTAQQKGVLFDLGHGGAGFWFDIALPALRQGLAPNSFGTDLHRFSMNAGMKSMLNVMSKYMAMGMSLTDVVLRATWNPARSVNRQDLGNLSPGAVADITILNVQQGKFGFVDAGSQRITGTRKLEAELTIRAGKIVWDLNGLAAKDWKK